MEALVNRVKLFYTDSGKTTTQAASVVVFIHAYPLDHTMWQEQVKLLEPHFRVITYDLRGHGQSQAADGQYSFETLVDDFFGLLDHLKISQAVVCGLSIGGYIALRAAERDATRIQGLILCDTRAEADSNEAKLKRAANVRLLQERGAEPFVDNFLKNLFVPRSFTFLPQVTSAIRQVMLGNPLKGMIGTMIALATRTDSVAALSQIKVPTLILVGEGDVITPPSAAKIMHAAITGAQLAIIPDAGHLSNLENPQVFNVHLENFFKAFKR